MGSRLEKNSNSVRKRIAAHTFDGEDGDEYGGSTFGGFTDYFRRKKIKLQNLDVDTRSQAGDKPKIFRGVVAHVNGYTQPSLNDLHTLIVQHGGGFMQYLDGKTAVTHIVASSLTPKKVVDFRQYRIVKPAWVVDSIAAGKLLPWNNYRVVDEGETQKVLYFNKGTIVSTTNSKQKGYRDQTDNSWYTSQLRASHIASPAAPQSPNRMRLLLQKPPTLEDDGIEDLPPSHQPEEPWSSEVRKAEKKGGTLITQLKTSFKAVHEPPPNKFVNIDHVSNELHGRLYVESATTKPLPDKGRKSTPPKHRIHATDIPANPQKSSLTAEEHNAILLRDPKIRRSTVVDPNFLEQYYRESRLHHLSTWKTDLKYQLQALANERTATQKAKQKVVTGGRRYILHVDFDSFFAAVSLKKNPELKTKPVAVAHSQGSGSEIASCNYPARKYGIKNGMWMKRAMELCPDLKILPYDFPAYEEASRSFYDVILAVGGFVQSVSIDEALIDVSNICITAGGSVGRQMNGCSVPHEQDKADEIAKSLREKVKLRTDCDVSVGIGNNILLAKVALRKAKPAGQHQIKPGEALDFIGQLKVQDLPGVAWSIGGKLEDIGVKLVKDIREITKERLVQLLGPKTGEKLFEYSHGIDRQEVGEQVVRKSVSAEVNWGVRFATQEQAEEFIASLCGELQKRLLKEKFKGKQFTMKIMRRAADAPVEPPKHLGHGKCDTFNRSLVLGVATNSKDILAKEALSMLRGFGFSPGELRGIGVQMTKLEPMRSVTDGGFDGSQRRLQFKMPEHMSARKRLAGVTERPACTHKMHFDVSQEPASVPREPPILHKYSLEEPRSISEELRKTADIHHSSPPFAMPSPAPASTFKEPGLPAPSIVEADPIQDDPETPHKPKTPAPTAENHVAFGAAELNCSTPSRRPLNMMGTQFILPSQVDPKVLAELPSDIRSKLFRQRKTSPTPIARREDSPNLYAPDSPCTPSKPPFAATALPAQSQLDPEILAALPDDVRAEIISHYSAAFSTQLSPSRRYRGADQTILPQSPRRNRIIGIPTKKPMQTKRGRGRPPRNATLAVTAHMKAVSKDGKALTQANLVSIKNSTRHLGEALGEAGSAAVSENQEGGLDPAFLAALPEDVRKEVITEHKAAKLRASRLTLQKTRVMPSTSLAQLPSENAQSARLKSIKVPRPTKATFTREKLHKESEVHSSIRDWVNEFADEGPYPEDVDALNNYLSKVALEENDLRKCVSVIKWLIYVVGDIGDAAEGRELWEDAVMHVKGAVSRAAKARGLGSVNFD